MKLSIQSESRLTCYIRYLYKSLFFFEEKQPKTPHSDSSVIAEIAKTQATADLKNKVTEYLASTISTSYLR